MQNIKKYFMTLALLLTAVTGAWAQSTLNVVEIEVPADWEGDNSYMTAADLTGFKTSTSAEALAWTGAPKTGYAMLFYAFDGDVAYYVPFNNGEPLSDSNSSFGKNLLFGYSTAAKLYYTAEPTEWSLTPDETGKKWTLAEMPASNVELQMEYFAESNLFLGKEALADKANITVKNGETAVDFGDDGKSTTTVTEGNTVTAKFTGKKVLGMKVEKKEAVTYPLLSAATAEDIGKVVCAAGHLHDAKTAVPDGCTAVGILGKVTETGHGLILALHDATYQEWVTVNGWASETSYAGTTLKVLPDDAARGTNLTSYTKLGDTAVSNWAVAQKDDYVAIFVNLGSEVGDTDGITCSESMDVYITPAGGTSIYAASGLEYISATSKNDEKCWGFNYSYWKGVAKSGSYNAKNVRPVLGF